MTLLKASEIDVALTDQRQLRAFIGDEPTRKVVDQVVTELMIPNAAVHRGGIRDAIRQLGEQRSPRLLIVDLNEAELPLSAINELAEVCEPGVAVIAIGTRNDVGLFRDLINNGVSDYLVKPITPLLLQKSLLSVLDGTSPTRHTSKLGRLIAVTGARGGVGSTMLAVNLAWTIAHRRRRRVALVDLDLHYGTAALALDLEPSPGMREALEQGERIDSLFVERAMVRQSDTLYVLSGEEALGEPVVPDTAALEALLRDLRNKFHYVIVDVPRQVTSCTHHVLETATNLLLITDLSLAGMRDTLRRTMLMPAVNAACQLSIIANRTGEYREGEISRREFEAGLGRAIDAMIPFDARSVTRAANAGQPVAAGRNKVAAAIQEITDKLAGSGSSRSSIRSWLERLTWR
ncbi:AAA family ATPase [Benzoatithermus flavus]|uniref:AAA family ATPase n=1 Tax=Benzoatithermus flavus TaxID=3108223 RepID=A0ABU8Y1T5_9PROT